MNVVTHHEPDESRDRFQSKTADLGIPHANVDRALQLAEELEDEELISRMKGFERNK